MPTITFAEVTDWLATQPGHRTFDMRWPETCLVAQYLAAKTYDGNKDFTQVPVAGTTGAYDPFGVRYDIEPRLTALILAPLLEARDEAAGNAKAYAAVQRTTNQLLLLAFPDRHAPT